MHSSLSSCGVAHLRPSAALALLLGGLLGASGAAAGAADPAAAHAASATAATANVATSNPATSNAAATNAATASATTADTKTSPAARLIALGVPVASKPVRERPGWRPPHIVLVSERLHELLPQLKQAAPGVKLIEFPTATAGDVAAADALIGICSDEVLGQAKRLEWIQWTAAGVERCVHQRLVRERGLLVTNAQRVAAPSMAEHVLAMMLALSRHLGDFLRAQQQAHWVKDEAPELEDLEGKTLLVVGLGGIGTEVARRAHAFGMRVIATRASGHSGPDFVSYVGTPEELLKLTREADFVVNCAPLTAETTGIFNHEFFAAMRPGAYFLSVGRGRSTVTADLIAALGSGKLAGAGLDVTDPEPLPADSPLWRLPNVIITPHISGNSPATDEQYATLLTENLRRYIAGEPMLAVVDVARGY
jgi:phosphoglycerate dehydrogenase-like enzyme